MNDGKLNTSILTKEQATEPPGEFMCLATKLDQGGDWAKEEQWESFIRSPLGRKIHRGRVFVLSNDEWYPNFYKLFIFGPLEGCCCLWGKVRNSLLFFQPSTKCLLVLSILFTWSFWNSYIFCEELNQPDYPHSSSSTASSVESVMLYCFLLHQYTPWELWLSSQMVVLFFIY